MDRAQPGRRPERAPGSRPERSTGRGGQSPRPAGRAAIEQREYDPRREERRAATRIALPEGADPRLLDEDTRRELRSLSRESAELVSGHLVATGQLLDDEPERALAHARAARALAGRVGVVRLAAGLAAYAAQAWNEALSELRAARRITGRPEHLAVMADCERALGRPERALAYGDDPEVTSLSQDERVELVIVLAGARRDMGQVDAAVLALQTPARATTAKRPWAVRLWYAYADALLAAGRDGEAREWFWRTAGLDDDGQTDAADRVLELDGVLLEDLSSDEAEDETGDEAGGMDDAALAAYVAEGFSTTQALLGEVAVGDAAVGDAALGDAADGQVADGAVVHDDLGVDAVAAVDVAQDDADGAARVARSEDEARDTTEAGGHEPGRALTGPFSQGVVEQEPASASRPSAALTPTFAAPDADEDGAGA